MHRFLATFEAKCGACGYTFFAPSLGNQAYGEAIFTTSDGRLHALADGFQEFPKRLADLLPASGPKQYWSTLASLADPLNGQGMVSGLVCPSCSASKMTFWEGQKGDAIEVPGATFHDASNLPDAALIERSEHFSEDRLDA
jgi:hypothetical protein